MLFVHHSDFSVSTAPITSNDLLVVLNSGCTCTISFNKNDFVGPICPIQYVELKGIASGLLVQGIGRVYWTFLDNNSEWICIPLTCLYMPDASTHLLLLQQLSN